MPQRIPVCAGPRILEFCDEVSVRRYLNAPNAEVVRARKNKRIVRVNLREMGDDSEQRSFGGGVKLTYEEHLDAGKLTVLKRFDEEKQSYVHWGPADGFNPFRFNPDRVVMARS